MAWVLVPWFTLGFLPGTAQAVILWSDLEPRVIHSTPAGSDILGGKVKRDDTANDALYFRLEVDPLSDVASEHYLAGFQLFEDEQPRLGVGNAWEAWGYSAFGASETSTISGSPGEYDLKSSQPEAAGLGTFKPYELPHHNEKRVIVFKVQYVPGGDDLVTVWLSPHLSHGDTDANQPENLTTKFKADCSFNQIRLRHDGGGNGWIFSDMAVATSFTDFVIVRFWQTWWFASLMSVALLAAVAVGVRVVERRKFQRRLQLAEQERALERERTRIAQDLHDDLGSSLARISLLSGLAGADARQPAQVEAHMRKIAESANETVRALEEIVWAVRPVSDTLQSLVEYITHFATELFDGTGTPCRLDMPASLPARPLPPDLRHNIFLVVKEALTNAIRHSGAKEVRVRVRVNGAALEIEVEDDGRGFEQPASAGGRTGHGLGNMQRRADAIGAQLETRSQPGKGTVIRLVTPFPKPVGR